MNNLEAVLAVLTKQPMVFSTVAGELVGVTDAAAIANDSVYLAVDLAAHPDSPEEIARVLMKHGSRVGVEMFHPLVIGALNIILANITAPAFDELKKRSPKSDMRKEMSRNLIQMEMANGEHIS
jgi:hypothetical protein